MQQVYKNVLIHCRKVVNENEKVLGYDEVLVDKQANIVAKKGFMVLQSNNEVHKSTKVSLQKVYLAQQSSIRVNVCYNVLIHCSEVVNENRNTQGHCFRIHQYLPKKHVFSDYYF